MLEGNTILRAQPTADVSCVGLPPPACAFVQILAAIVARNNHDLSMADWALDDSAVYMRIVRERTTCCPRCADAVTREDLADTRLLASGVPVHISVCAQDAQGADHAPNTLAGPASSRPVIGRQEDA